MKKKTLLIIVVVSILLSVIFLGSIVFAYDPDPSKIAITQPEDTGVQTLGSKIIGFIQIVGIIVSVGILMVLGIKYMMGSASEKAEYKKVFIPYIIGAILLFSATTIAGAVYNAVNSTSSTQGNPDSSAYWSQQGG